MLLLPGTLAIGYAVNNVFSAIGRYGLVFWFTSRENGSICV